MNEKSYRQLNINIDLSHVFCFIFDIYIYIFDLIQPFSTHKIKDDLKGRQEMSRKQSSDRNLVCLLL